MTSTIVLHDATLFDSERAELRAGATVTIEGERIADVGFGTPARSGARVYALNGHTLLPGLIDAHVHATATTPDFFRLSLQPQSLTTAQSKDILAGMLMRGFTTVRDAGGADLGRRLEVRARQARVDALGERWVDLAGQRAQLRGVEVGEVGEPRPHQR